MKKICSFLIVLGALGIMASGLLKLMQIDHYNVHTISELFFVAGIVLVPFAGRDRLKKLIFGQKLLLFVLWVGFLLISCSHLVQFIYWDGRRYLLIAGFSMVLLAGLYILIYRIADLLRIEPKGKLVSIETLSAFGLNSADLNQHVGEYTNKKIPLTITITEKNNSLVAQATKQSAFYLEVIGKNEFKYPKRDIVIEFNLEKNELILKQHGGYFLFEKEV